jgi:hypothetical protein
MKNVVFWDFTLMALVRTDVSEELSDKTRIGEVGTTLAVNSVVLSSPILVTLMKEALSSSERSVLTRVTWRKIPEDTILQLFRGWILSLFSDGTYLVWPIR